MGKLKPKVGMPNALPADAILIHRKPGETEEAAMARVALNPTARAALSTRQFNTIGEEPAGLNALAVELSGQVEQLHQGDLSRAEEMLMAQAHTLDAIFNKLAVMAVGQGMLNQYETFMRLALKAQGQARATLETLAVLKNPVGPMFVRQANIAHGPQQVNNRPGSSLEPLSASPKRAHADVPAREKSENPPNELKEVSHEQSQRLDTGTPEGAVGADSPVPSVGAVNRANNVRRKSS